MTPKFTLSADRTQIVDDHGNLVADVAQYSNDPSFTDRNAFLLTSAPALYAALEAISALRPPLMTKEQEKAFEYHPSTCDAYRVDLSKVLLAAISEARAALALARGEKGESK